MFQISCKLIKENTMGKYVEHENQSSIHKSKIVYGKFNLLDIHFISDLYKFSIQMEIDDPANSTFATVPLWGFGIVAQPIQHGYPTLRYDIKGAYVKGARRVGKALFCYSNAAIEKPDHLFVTKYQEASDFEMRELTPFIKNIFSHGYTM